MPNPGTPDSRPYVSSITSRYGDLDRVKADARTITDIMNRQGTTFVVDSLAEYLAQGVNDLKLSEENRGNVVKSVMNELREALLERI